MDFKQIENSIKISEATSISSAAEGLFITQSALNQQLIHLEEELGVKLFTRSKAGVCPTEAGVAYLQYAKKLMAIKQEMTNVLNDFSSFNAGTIRIGMPIIHGGEVFTHVFPKFHRKYPNIKLEPTEMSYSQRFQMIASGELDLAFVTLMESEKTDDEYYPILKEELFLAAPKNHPLTAQLKLQQEVDLKQLENENFVMINRNTTLRKCTDRIFKENGFIPHIILETSSYKTISTIVSFGEAFSIIPQLNDLENAEIEYLPLIGHPFRTFYAMHKRGMYMSRPLKDFLEMSLTCWK